MSEVLLRVKDIFCKTEGVEFAYLFGSYASGEITPHSDIDIAVYFSKADVSLDDELRFHSFLSRELKSNKIDIVVINRIDNIMLLEEIVRYGKVVYDKNPSLRAHFELSVLHGAIDFRYQRTMFAGR